MNLEFRYKNLNLTQFRSFCRVATEGSFAAAATQLRLSTPTVWQQVRALERTLHARLVTRHGRGVALTGEGRLLLELVRAHVGAFDSVPRLFAERRPDLAPTVSIAVTQSVLDFRLPEVVRAFRVAEPTARLQTTISNPAAISTIPEGVRLVEQGTVDLAITGYDPSEPRAEGLNYDELTPAPLCLLTPSRHPLNRRQAIQPNEVVRYPLILVSPGGVDHAALRRWLDRHGIVDPVWPVLEARFLESVIRYVAAGIGVAVCHVTPEAHRQLTGVRCRPIPGESGRPEALLTRRGVPLVPAAEKFRRIVCKHLGTASTRSGDKRPP